MTGDGTPLRVVWVDDDRNVRHLVSIVFAGMAVQLETVEGAEAALLRVRASRVDLLVTDLHLPGLSGWELIQRLRGGEGPAALQIAVFSGTAVEAVRPALAVWGVQRVLQKPGSIGALRALVLPASADPVARPVDPVPRIVDEHFGGNQDLYLRFRRSSEAQFRLDRRVGDACAGAGDVEGMRLLAHSLKSVLRLLGEARHSQAMAELEVACVQGNVAAMTQRWFKFRDEFPDWGR